MDYKKLAQDILEQAGGAENVASAGHCVTRLRITCKSLNLASQENLKKIFGVRGLIVKGNELQAVIGTDVSDVYKEFIQLGSFTGEGQVAEKEKEKTSVLNQVVKYISGSIYPYLAILTASALVGAICTLLTTFCGLSTESGTYMILHTIYDAVFYFMPVFVGFAAAKVLQMDSYLGAFLGAILVHSTLNGAEGLTFLGIAVPVMTYSSTIIPVLLGVAFMGAVDRVLGRRIPKVVSFFFRPLVDIMITLPVTLIVLGPLGGVLGNYIAAVLNWINGTLGWFSLVLLGLASPLLVMTGMHTPLIPLGVQGFMAMGYDGFILPSMLAANCAIGGAALAVSVKSRKASRKQSASTAGITAVVGITEPALYGVCIPLKKPLIGAVIGGGVGGFFYGVTGVRMFGLNSPGIASLPLFINPDGTMTNLILACIGILISFAVGFAATWILGFDDSDI